MVTPNYEYDDILAVLEACVDDAEDLSATARLCGAVGAAEDSIRSTHLLREAIKIVRAHESMVEDARDRPI